MVNRVLLLRHGETALNRQGALRGEIDVPLSSRGVREARLLAQRIAADDTLTAIYSSTLVRARATAQEIARATKVRVRVDERLNDMRYGPWAGRPFGDLTTQEQAEFRRWRRNPGVPLPGAEDPEAVQERALAALAACAERERGCIAIVAHNAILQLVLCHVLGRGGERYRKIAQHTASLNELAYDDGHWNVLRLNSTEHLRGSKKSAV